MEFWAQIYLGRARGARINRRRWEEFLRRSVSALATASTTAAEALTPPSRCKFCDQPAHIDSSTGIRANGTK